MPYETRFVRRLFRERVQQNALPRNQTQHQRFGPQIATQQRQPLSGNANFIDQAGQTLIGMGCIDDMRT